MQWSARIGLSAVMFTVGGGLAVGMTVPQVTTADRDAQAVVDADGLGEIERNCWDPTQWDGPAPTNEKGILPGGCVEQTPHAGGPVPPPPPPPMFRSYDFNPGKTLPRETLQVVTFYDGAASESLSLAIEYTCPYHGTGWMTVDSIPASTSNKGALGTYEFGLNSATPTGRVRVTGAVPNGVIDGLAFGMFWRDGQGMHILRSTSPEPKDTATFVGAWPIGGLSDAAIRERTPYLTTSAARGQTRMIISGAEYLENGTYRFAIQGRGIREPQLLRCGMMPIRCGTE